MIGIMTTLQMPEDTTEESGTEVKMFQGLEFTTGGGTNIL